ncbi:unnamed protein product [Bursaphelenchus xylophilus]|uniref:(pine wood nematode) hypothetical protein n=1 Tax=Bursaphelenchus xylophilus TaxID=6326 RepID=A0A1I7S1A5_BURXY|nr:unnamed protein product [Bursaphelenchus xylophilus]CAG9080192.1 unnamed protein product [Bursaphelenchus xylophilus]
MHNTLYFTAVTNFRSGRAILTADPRCPLIPIDITDHYYNIEPSSTAEAAERLEKLGKLVKKPNCQQAQALKTAGALERYQKIRLLYGSNVLQNASDVGVTVTPTEAVVFGDNVVVEIEFKNNSPKYRTVNVSVRVHLRNKDGKVGTQVNGYKETYELSSGQSESLRLLTPVSEYIRVSGNDSYDFVAVISGTVQETGQIFFHEENFHISTSILGIVAPATAVVDQVVIALIAVTNPLPEPLKYCKLELTSGHKADQVVHVDRMPSEIAPGQRIKLPIRIRLPSLDLRVLVAKLHCEPLGKVTATHILEVGMDNLMVTVCENIDNQRLGIYAGARFDSFEAFRSTLVEWMAITHQRMAINSSRQMGVKYGAEARERFKFRSIYFRCFRHGPGRRTERKQPNREKNARDCGAYLRVVFDPSADEMVISTCHLKHRFHTPCREDTVKMVGRRSQWFEWVEELAPSRGQMISRYIFSDELYTPDNVFESLQHLHHIGNVMNTMPMIRKHPAVKLIRRNQKPRATIEREREILERCLPKNTANIPIKDLQLFTSAVQMMKFPAEPEKMDISESEEEEVVDEEDLQVARYIEISDSPAKYEKFARRPAQEKVNNTMKKTKAPMDIVKFPTEKRNLTLESEQKLKKLLDDLGKAEPLIDVLG